MSTVAEHYRNLLADAYSWMLGGFEAGIGKNVEFLEQHDIRPRGSGIAVDLGAGCGFQAIPLARAGFNVTAIDLDPVLLDELERQRGATPVRTIADNFMNFDAHLDEPAEVVVCMTDSLLHLESTGQVIALFEKLYSAIEPGGRFIATFRDLSSPLEDLQRFIPVRSDDSRILTCFLEDDGGRAKVHDLLYEKHDGKWQLAKSYYYKLRLPPEQTRSWLLTAGFGDVRMTVDNALATIIAVR